MSTTLHSKILPPTWLLTAVLIMLGLHFTLPAAQIVPAPWMLLGLIPLVAGITISTIADRDFKQVGTTVNPFEKPSQMITSGLFHFSRNPMYLGFLVLLVGIAILLGSLTPLGVILPFIWLINTRFIRIEEQMMAAQFGQDWLEYKAKVRRWI
jgi:protein-S-isoprenylcysteine O-methyltransferase Ste14